MKKFLFIPGLLGDATLWQPLIKSLPKQCIHQFIDINNGSTLEEVAYNLWKQVDGEVILVGFSLGAWIALQAYLLFPKRCQALILISSAPGNLTPATRDRFLAYIQQIATGNFATFIQADLEQDIATINKRNTQIKETLITMMQKQGPEIAIKQLKYMLQFKGNFNNLSYIHCPTLLLRGLYDESINSKRQDEIFQEIPQAELKIIADAAHYIPLENPVLTAQTIQAWLKSQNV